ncbi:S8 family serine peptidase [Robertkochia flava]|uniref:S8 family serine peptidase n=1 Tax=Robertkochia flava TaxID=3447986 RepID=UPI001CCBC830|nr:S8 family serine peptidase [Robertkochia marina]
MNNHRRKLLQTASLVLWFLLGSNIVFSQTTQGSSTGESASKSTLKGMAAKFKKRAIANKAAAVKKAHIHGWKIAEELAGGGFRELQQVDAQGNPIYKVSFNDVIVKTSRSEFLSNGLEFDFGVDGTDMTIGVWDSGKALPEHQEFDDRFIAGDNTPRISGHATHVLGTAIASGVNSKARGVAFNARGMSFDWNQDEGEVAEQAAEGLLISNHSYGLSGRNLPDWYFGSYIYQAQDWDEIMYAAPYYLMVTAAGNTQHLGYNEAPLEGDASEGYDLLLGFAVSKNGLTVAAADNIKVDGNGQLLQADIASFSNFGPADDGRIKPDITGAGVNVLSSFSDSEDSYRTLSGTSMASPGVAASLLLLQQYHYLAFGTYMRASTLKGLALHTADEAGETPGPDPKFGWGIINSKRASEVIEGAGVNTRIEENELRQGREYALTVTAIEGETLSVSLSWTDPAFPSHLHGTANDNTPVLVNDLDIRVTKDGETYFPWKLSLSDLRGGAVKGDNRVDPFEKIEIPNASGEYTIVVSHKGELANTSQAYALIVSGISETGCTTVAPEAAVVDEVGQHEALLSWNLVNDAFYEVRYKRADQETWESKMVSEGEIRLSGLIENTEYMVEVRSLCSELLASEYGETLVFMTKDIPQEEPDPETGEDTPPEDSGDNTADLPEGETGIFDPDVTDPEGIREAVDPGEGVRFLDPETGDGTISENTDGMTFSPEDLLLVRNTQEQTVYIRGAQSALGPYYIVDAVGRIVKTGRDATQPISISELSSGLYVLVFEKSQVLNPHKFIK